VSGGWPGPGGRAGAVVGAVGRHPYVDDGQVRVGGLDGRDERRRVAGLGHNMVAGVDEQCGEAFAEEGGVFPYHDPHGRTASIRVP
jgi:hypothetical protein